ncbi:hypothetical protein BLD44_029645 [Mastigocladus laminosus UU774]|nr:hypothetical protein BLD44_029645 [Mastigocladus laminosus UU774]
MLKETLKLYPSWDIEKTAIPQRSRLYHLEPIGIGTPYVESLTGYVQRIAHEHCVTVRRLTITEIAPLMGKEAKLLDESISKVFGTGRDRTAFNGTGLMATNLVGAMSALTGRLDLRYLTLLPWAQVISKRGLLRRHRAWCPKCYQQWHDNHTSVYEPLLWSINTAQVCPYHHQPLQEQCPYCHQQQLTISGDSRTGHCNKCGKWLGNNRYKTVVTNQIKSEAERNRQLNVANNLGELVAVTPTLNYPPNFQKLSNTISTYILQVLKSSIPAFSRQSGMNKATIGLWCKGKVIPQIDNLLVLTHYLEISLLDFLTTDVLLADSKNTCLETELNVVKQPRKSYKHLDLERKQVLNVVLIEVLKEYPAPSLEDVALRLRYRPLVLQYHFPSLCESIKIRHAEYRKVSKQQKIQPILEAALKEFPPPSLLSINRRLGYKNNSYLYRYFSELSREISKRYKEYQKARGQEKRERICQEIIDIAQLLHETGHKPTQARVTKLLSKPAVMLSWYAKKTLRDVQSSLGYE